MRARTTGLRRAGRRRSAKARGRRGSATEGRGGRHTKTVRAPRSTRHFTTTRAGSAGASSSRVTSVARLRCTVRSSSSGRKYAGSPGANSMPKNGDMAPRAEAVPSYYRSCQTLISHSCESRRRKNHVGVQRVGWLIVRFHLLRPLGRLYGSTYYWMLPPIPTARASLTCPPPRRSPPPASGSTGTTGRSCIPESGKEGFRVRRARGWEGLRRRRERALVYRIAT
jgi:hypothetical protein